MDWVGCQRFVAASVCVYTYAVLQSPSHSHSITAHRLHTHAAGRLRHTPLRSCYQPTLLPAALLPLRSPNTIWPCPQVQGHVRPAPVPPPLLARVLEEE